MVFHYFIDCIRGRGCSLCRNGGIREKRRGSIKMGGYTEYTLHNCYVFSIFVSILVVAKLVNLPSYPTPLFILFELTD